MYSQHSFFFFALIKNIANSKNYICTWYLQAPCNKKIMIYIYIYIYVFMIPSKKRTYFIFIKRYFQKEILLDIFLPCCYYVYTMYTYVFSYCIAFFRNNKKQQHKLDLILHSIPILLCIRLFHIPHHKKHLIYFNAEID